MGAYLIQWEGEHILINNTGGYKNNIPYCLPINAATIQKMYRKLEFRP